MSRTAATLFTDALEAYDVTHVFGNPGTTELPVMDALGRSDLEYVLGLHEDVAVGMAAGYAKRRWHHCHADPTVNPLGVVNLHIAPGVAHGLGNVFDAGHTGAPLLVTAGNHPLDHQHHEPNLGGDLVRMTEQYTKWSAEVKDADAFPTMLRRAVRTALSPPAGPTFLALPLDVMLTETDAAIEPLGEIPTAGPGDPRALDRAADRLAEAEEPVLLVGDGVARAGPDAVAAAVRLAETLGARVHGEFKASEVAFPTAHPQWVGRLPRDQELAAEYLDVDVLLSVGAISNVPTNPVVVDLVGPDTTQIHVSESARELGKNEPAHLAVVADPGQALIGLADRLEGRVPDDVRGARRTDAEATRERALEAADPGAPDDDPRASNAQLAAAMHAAAPDALVVAEAPTSTGAVKAAYAFGNGDFMANRGGGLGYGLPAAVGAAVAEAQLEAEGGVSSDVIGFIGDGSYLYYPQTLYSAARHGVDLTVVVPDNRNYRILKDNTLRIMGGEEADYDFVGMDFDPPVDIPRNAESHGATGRLVDDPGSLEDALREAVAEPGPSVVDVLTHD